MATELATPQRAYSVETTAALLDTTRDAIRSRIQRGQIRAARVGRRLLISDAEIKRVLTPVDGHEQDGGA